MTADPSIDNVSGGYRHRALTPAQVQAVGRSLAAGVPAATLARIYGCHVRTIYRARHAAQLEWTRVVVGEWAAEFYLTEWGPIRCTPWVPA
jgi:DNA invertase Pin-like site-specific DNA recombinase